MRISKILHLVRDPQFIADTCAMVVFSWIVGIIIEMGVAGMSLQQSLQTRIVATGTNILTGGMDGKWLDIVRCRFHANQSIIRGFTSDVVAFVTFQAVIYTVNLMTTGVSLEQIAKAVGSAAIFCGIAGKPYGLATDWIRRLFRVHSK